MGGNRTVQAATTYRFDFLSRAELVVASTAPVLGEASTAVRLSYQKIQQQDSPWAYQASYAMLSNAEDLVSGSLGYLFASNIRVSGQADSNGAWMVSVNYALPFRVSGEGVRSFEPGTFGRAGLTGEVFMDDNGDGIRQAEEGTLSDVRILAPGISDLYSDEQGRYRGWGMPAGRPIGVEVDLLTTDALFTPLKPKYLLTPHPGELVRLDIPLVAAGGLAGVLSSGVRRSISPANGIEMILETAAGERVAAVQAEWDGTFIMEGIPPGRYVLYGNPEELAARGIQLNPDRMELVFPAGTVPAWKQELIFRIERRGGGALPGTGPRRRGAGEG